MAVERPKNKLVEAGLDIATLRVDDTPLPNFEKVSYGVIASDLDAEYSSLEGGYNDAKSFREEWYKQYAFAKYNNEVEGKSSFVDSTCFDLIEWMLPSLLKPFVEGADAAIFTPERKKDVIPALVLREIISFQLKRNTNDYELHHDSLKGELIFSECYGKVSWVPASVSNKNFGSPEIKPVHPDKMRRDWAAPNLESSKVVTYEEDMSRSDIIKMMKGKTGIIEDKFNAVLNTKGREFHSSHLRDEKLLEKGRVGEEARNPSQSRSLYLRREQWSEYDMYGTGKGIPILAVFLDDVLVQVIKNPFNHGRPPFVWSQAIRNPNSSASISLVDVMSDIQKYKTGIMRMFADNIDAQNNGMYEVDRLNADDIVFDLLELGMPKTGLPVTKPGSINPINPAPIAGQAFNILELANVAGENRGGFTRFSQGLDSSSLNQTATGYVGITQKSELRMWEIVMRYKNSFYVPMIRMMISLNQQFMDMKQLRLQYGPEVGGWIDLDKSMIDGATVGVDVDIDVGSASQSKVDGYSNFMTTITPFIGKGIPERVISVTAVEMAKELGLKTVEFAMLEGTDYVTTAGISVAKEFIDEAQGAEALGDGVQGQPNTGGGGEGLQEDIGAEGGIEAMLEGAAGQPGGEGEGGENALPLGVS